MKTVAVYLEIRETERTICEVSGIMPLEITNIFRDSDIQNFLNGDVLLKGS